MKKKIEIIVRNTMIFWIFVDVMPGIESYHGLGNLFIASIGYALLRFVILFLLSFFRIRKHLLSVTIAGILLTILYFYSLNTFFVGILDFYNTSFGSIDVGAVHIKQTDNIALNGVIILGSIIVNFCSIMLAKLQKSDI